jgi:hypothetical protein
MAEIEFYQPNLTDEQRENLRTLARGLIAYEGAVKFWMGSYAENDADDDDYEVMPFKVSQWLEKGNECGAVACACGHGPLLGIKANPDEGWDEYARRCFTGGDDNVWTWCFAGRWSAYDDTREGAARRITFMLDKGIPPDTSPRSELVEFYRDYNPDWLQPKSLSPEAIAVANALRFT